MTIRTTDVLDAPAWYVRLKDGESGPLDASGLAKLRLLGRIGSDTPVRRGSGSWKPFRDHPVSKGILEGPLRPPKPRRRADVVLHAGAGARMRASTIDGLAVSVLVWLPGLALPGMGWTQSLVLGFVVSVLYGVLPVCGPWKATPGKRACSVFVARADGEEVGIGTACARHAASFLSWLPFCAGYLTIFFRRDRAALHDILCGTIVVEGRAEEASGR